MIITGVTSLSKEYKMLFGEKIWSENYQFLHDQYIGRAYHNLAHILHSLTELEFAHRDNIINEHYLELQAAIWYHDIFSSEKDSADLAQSILIGLCDTSIVHNLIMATKHEKLPESYIEQIMVDIDLSILGSDDFSVYEERIRAEYADIPEYDFLFARRKIMRKFLKPYREFVYCTEYFRSKYEMKARRNLSELVTNYIFRMDKLLG